VRLSASVRRVMRSTRRVSIVEDSLSKGEIRQWVGGDKH
jgi:hypothetical protein